MVDILTKHRRAEFGKKFFKIYFWINQAIPVLNFIKQTGLVILVWLAVFFLYDVAAASDGLVPESGVFKLLGKFALWCLCVAGGYLMGSIIVRYILRKR